jgi:hypothetical protein
MAERGAGDSTVRGRFLQEVRVGMEWVASPLWNRLLCNPQYVVPVVKVVVKCLIRRLEPLNLKLIHLETLFWHSVHYRNAHPYLSCAYSGGLKRRLG